MVDLFGYRRSYRFIPDDPIAPFPARKHLFRSGTIDLGRLPPKLPMDTRKGLSFRIPHRDDYEFVSMIKSAYLMVFSLMGQNGYRFAENIGLRAVREQIMNPGKKILKDGFIGTMRLESDEYRKIDRPVVFLCRTERSPFWIVPMGDDRVVFLSCGAGKPVREMPFNATKFSIPFGGLVGWVSRRFDSSCAIAGTGREANDEARTSLAGAVSDPFPISETSWHYVVVFHQMKDFVALPYCQKGEFPDSEAMINVVDMLSEHEVAGRNLDRTHLTRANFGAWSRELVAKRMPLVGERGTGDKLDR